MLFDSFPTKTQWDNLQHVFPVWCGNGQENNSTGLGLISARAVRVKSLLFVWNIAEYTKHNLTSYFCRTMFQPLNKLSALLVFFSTFYLYFWSMGAFQNWNFVTYVLFTFRTDPLPALSAQYTQLYKFSLKVFKFRLFKLAPSSRTINENSKIYASQLAAVRDLGGSGNQMEGKAHSRNSKLKDYESGLKQIKSQIEICMNYLIRLKVIE